MSAIRWGTLRLNQPRKNLERRAGIEPASTGFADLRVSHFATGAFGEEIVGKLKTHLAVSGWVRGIRIQWFELSHSTRPRGAALTAAHTDRGRVEGVRQIRHLAGGVESYPADRSNLRSAQSLVKPFSGQLEKIDERRKGQQQAQNKQRNRAPADLGQRQLATLPEEINEDPCGDPEDHRNRGNS